MNFAKFLRTPFLTEHLRWPATEACNFIKKETLAQVFSCELCEISKNTYFTEHLWATAAVYHKKFITENFS